MLTELDDATLNTQQQWVKFMLERVGHNNLPSLLDYYESIGWISMDVADTLITLAEKEKQRYLGPTWTLSPEEHRTSMLFIEKLMGRQVDVSILSVPSTGRAKLMEKDRVSAEPREGYVEAHLLEKEELEFQIERREVTIKNLEQELEKREDEIVGLKERIKELEEQVGEYGDEVKMNRVYREMLEENVRLKKASFSGRARDVDEDKKEM